MNHGEAQACRAVQDHFRLSTSTSQQKQDGYSALEDAVSISQTFPAEPSNMLDIELCRLLHGEKIEKKTQQQRRNGPPNCVGVPISQAVLAECADVQVLVLKQCLAKPCSYKAVYSSLSGLKTSISES